MLTTIKVYAYYAVKSYENKSIKIPTDMGGGGHPVRRPRIRFWFLSPAVTSNDKTYYLTLTLENCWLRRGRAINVSSIHVHVFGTCIYT